MKEKENVCSCGVIFEGVGVSKRVNSMYCAHVNIYYIAILYPRYNVSSIQIAYCCCCSAHWSDFFGKTVTQQHAVRVHVRV